MIGRLVTSERPRSPRAIWQHEVAVLRQERLVEAEPLAQRRARRRARLVAEDRRWSGRPGRPGPARTRASAPPSRVGSASSSRLTTKRSMGAPRAAGRRRLLLLGRQLGDQRAEVDARRPACSRSRRSILCAQTWSCSNSGTAQTSSRIFLCAVAQSSFCLARSGSERAASISLSATAQCEKLVTAVGVPTIEREWKNCVR